MTDQQPQSHIQAQTITLTAAEADEWIRLATAAYGARRNAIGKAFSVRAALHYGRPMPLAEYDRMQEIYRDWLIDNILPETL